MVIMIRERIKQSPNTQNYMEVIKKFERAERAQKECERSNGVLYVLDDPGLRDYIENLYRNRVCEPGREYIRKEARGILAGVLAKLYIA